MARIYRRTDRISVKIDEIEVKLAPLTFHQKTEIQQLMLEGKVNGDYKKLTEGIKTAVRCSLKGISGLTDSDGNVYQLKHSNDVLEEECFDDLMNQKLSEKLTMVCLSLLGGIPEQFVDEKGTPLEGVELVNSNKGEPEKNS